jgi:glutaryl-CoA dehydrogenase
VEWAASSLIGVTPCRQPAITRLSCTARQPCAQWSTPTSVSTTCGAPAENRLVGSRTFADTSQCLTKSRQSIAWAALGHAVASYECALTYVKHRTQFGQPLARFQLIQDKLARMVAEITAMQLMCVRMAQLAAEGRVELEHAALAKLSTAEGARRVCSMARDMLGGNGILLDHHVARHLADLEALYTFEGTDTVQALIVGRAITGLSAFV